MPERPHVYRVADVVRMQRRFREEQRRYWPYPVLYRTFTAGMHNHYYGTPCTWRCWFYPQRLKGWILRFRLWLDI